MIGEKYNGLVHTFYTVPIINDVWSNLNGGAGVTPGTDNWNIYQDIDENVAMPLYNRLGNNATNIFAFNTEDQPYLLNFNLRCNFGDGLVPVHNLTQANVADPFIANPVVNNVMIIRIETTRITASDTWSGNGTTDYPVYLWDSVYNVGAFQPKSIKTYSQDKGFFLNVSLRNNGNPIFSTISINPSFSTARVIVWAEFTIAHTFGCSNWSDL